jgi:hypothetical protein
MEYYQKTGSEGTEKKGERQGKDTKVKSPFYSAQRQKTKAVLFSGLPFPPRRVGHPYQTRTPPKRKKPRTSFSRLQICELEKRFHKQVFICL